jgi:ubiquitin-protein ligase
MAARLLKNQLNRKLRKTTRRHATIAEHAFSEVVLRFFNRILGWDDHSLAFWTVGLRADLEDYFGIGIIDDIDESVTPLRSCFDMWLLLKRVQQLSGIKLTDQAMAELRKNPTSFFLVSPDIRKMAVRVKHMNIISLAEANALAIQAMDSLDSVLRSSHNARAFHHDRLFSLAMSKFEQAIRSTPDNTAMLNHYAGVLERLALMKAGAGQECFLYFERAFERYNVARNWDCLMHLGETLSRLTPRWDEREKIPALANKCYLEVTQSESRRAEPFRRWGDVLVKSAAVTGNLKWIGLAGTKYRRAIELQPSSDFAWLASWHHCLTDEELATCVELLHSNGQISLKSDSCANPNYISDNLIIQVALNIKGSLKEISLEGCTSISDDAVIALANHCQSIQALNIRGCKSITDKAVGNVADLPQLQRLDLSCCPVLTSLSFKYIASKCVHLTHLNASFCDFQNSFISHLNTFGSSWLKCLDLSGLRILPEAWCRAINRMVLSQLEEIKLEGCSDLTDQCINVLAPRAPHLKRVFLVECTSLTDTAMFSLAQSCQKLEVVNIKQCVKLSSRSLTYFGSFFTGLQELHAQGCEKLFSDLSQLQYFLQNTGASLRKLSFDSTSVDDEAASIVATHCKQLASISLSFTRISSRAVAALVRTNLSLEVVDLSDSRIDDLAVISLATSTFSSLRSLRLAGCHALTDAAAEALRLCSNLEVLDLSQCSLITDEGISFIISGAPKLKHLKVNECRKLTDASIELIGRTLHSLQTFNAERCMLLARIGPLGLGCPELREINVRNSENIGDEGIESLGKLKLLRLLDVAGCRHVADGLLSILQVDSGCPALSDLYLGGNKMIDSAVQHLQSIRPRLRVSGAMYNTPISSSSESRRSNLASASSGELQPGSESPISKSLKKSADSSPRISSALFPTISRSNQTAARALMHDLNYINKNPLPFASARPLGDNLLLWHGNLTAPENSPYAGAVFHIQLTFPETYPTNPPSGTMLTPLPHPHVHRDRICLDLLSDFRGYFAAEGHKIHEGITGWSSAYSVQTILLQLQTFLMDLRPEDGGLPLHQYLSQIPESLKKANAFKCPHCEHSSENVWPPLGRPDDDMNEVPKSEADIIRDELKCFHTRVPFEEDVLGIGISITFHKTNSRDLDQIHSPLDLLSYTAFKEDGVRESVYSDSNDKKMNFTHWLPLWINKQHGERAESLLPTCLSLICTDDSNRFRPEMALTVLSKLMNGMYVLFKKNSNTGI